MTIASAEATRAQVADAIRQRQRFVVTSHARPDGDAIGSSLAMAYALRYLGKDVRVVSRDAPPPPLMVNHTFSFRAWAASGTINPSAVSRAIVLRM